MNIKVIGGFALAFFIGACCRLAGVPLPAPPLLIGALLVVAMTVGYTLTDLFAVHRMASQKANCGGPSGESPSKERE